MTRRLAGLFLLALLGVLLALGLALGRLGPLVVSAYAVVVVVLLALLGGRARALRRAASTPAPGQTCSCCSSTVHDPVRVV